MNRFWQLGGLLFLVVVGVTLTMTLRASGSDWEVDDYYGWPITNDPPESYRNETSQQGGYVLETVTVNSWGSSDPTTFLGSSSASLGGDFDGEATAEVSANHYRGSLSASAGDGWSWPVGVQFAWQGEEPSPGVVIYWTGGGHGSVWMYGMANAANGSSSAYVSSSGGGGPGDFYGDPQGGCMLYGYVECPSGVNYAGGDNAGYPGGDYSDLDYGSGSNSYGGSASWSLDASGVYRAGPGTAAVWVAGSGGASMSFSAHLSPVDEYAEGMAYATGAARGVGSYSASASSP